jgi:hypothetical protein
MQRYDRRQFLTRMSAGLAVAGAAAYLPRAAVSAAQVGVRAGAGAAGAGTGQSHDGQLDHGLVPVPGDVMEGPVVAYVRNASAGQISLFVGSREITVHDPAIAAALAHAAGKGV